MLGYYVKWSTKSIPKYQQKTKSKSQVYHRGKEECSN